MPGRAPPSPSQRPCGRSPRRRSARTCRAPSDRPCGLPPTRSSSPSSCPCSLPPFPPPLNAPVRGQLVSPALRRPAPRAPLGLAARRDQIAHALPAELSDLLVEPDPPLRLDGQPALAAPDQSSQPSRLADGHPPLVAP